jgi:hypothetical protein
MPGDERPGPEGSRQKAEGSRQTAQARKGPPSQEALLPARAHQGSRNPENGRLFRSTSGCLAVVKENPEKKDRSALVPKVGEFLDAKGWKTGRAQAPQGWLGPRVGQRLLASPCPPRERSAVRGRRPGVTGQGRAEGRASREPASARRCLGGFPEPQGPVETGVSFHFMRFFRFISFPRGWGRNETKRVPQAGESGDGRRRCVCAQCNQSNRRTCSTSYPSLCCSPPGPALASKTKPPSTIRHRERPHGRPTDATPGCPRGRGPGAALGT